MYSCTLYYFLFSTKEREAIAGLWYVLGLQRLFDLGLTKHQSRVKEETERDKESEKPCGLDCERQKTRLVTASVSVSFQETFQKLIASSIPWLCLA